MEVVVHRAEPCSMIGYRIVLLGGGGVGKTSIVMRFVGEGFSTDYTPTVDDIYRHIVRMPDGGIHGIEILDTAGLHQFPAMRQLSIQSGRAFIVVFSLDNLASFKEALQLIDLVAQTKAPDEVPIVLVGNKVDIAGSRVILRELAENEATKRSCAYHETSARMNDNIHEVFMGLLSRVFKQETKDTLSIHHRLSRRFSRKSSSSSQRSLGSDNGSELRRSLSCVSGTTDPLDGELGVDDVIGPPPASPRSPGIVASPNEGLLLRELEMKRSISDCENNNEFSANNSSQQQQSHHRNNQQQHHKQHHNNNGQQQQRQNQKHQQSHGHHHHRQHRHGDDSRCVVM